LILGQEEPGRTALSTLIRILRQRRLLASRRGLRGGTPCVCFTAARLSELSRLRTFRAHRRRWDFEPYGIGISRQWLCERGACPVVYGDESDWHAMNASQRPFFQRRYAGRDHTIDWSEEQEWRHIGDLDLTALPADAGFVFVSCADEVQRISGLSLWPVLAVS
jgi:hypothetical protein